MTKTITTDEEPLRKLKVLRQHTTQLEALDIEHQADIKLGQAKDVKIYKAVFESARNTILIIDKNGKIIDVNRSISEISGYEKEEFIGKNIRALAKIMTRKSMALIARNFLKQVAGSHVKSYQIEGFKKNGESITLEVSAQPLREDGKIIGNLAILRDITERKQSEQALRESQARFTETTDMLPTSVFEIDIQGKYTYLNKEALRAWHSTKPTMKDALADNPLNSFIQEDRDKIANNIKRILMGEDIGPQEHTALRDDGTTFPVLIYAAPIKQENKTIGIRGVVVDISEGKQGEQTLRESEQKYLMLVEKGNDGIIVICDGLLAFVNSKGLEMVGFTLKEVLGKPFVSFIAPEYRDLLKQRYLKRIAGESIPSSYEAAIFARDGRIIPVEINANTIEYEGKKSDLAIVRDITERKQAEEALKTSERNFRNSMDNSALGIRIIDENVQTLYVNQTFLNIVGYETIDEYAAIPRQKRYTPEEYTRYLQHVKGRKHGQLEEDNFEINIVRKDGSTRWLLLFRQEVFWNGKKQSQLTYEDITERKQVEEALKASEEKFRNSLDSSPLGIRIVDFDGHTSYANQAFLNIVGYETIDEYRTIPPQKRYTPESYANYILEAEQRKHNEKVQDKLEISIVRKDGSSRWLQVSSKEMFWDGKKQYQSIYEDITERKQVEEILKRNKDSLDEAQSIAHVGSFEINIKTGKNEWSEELFHIFGLDPAKTAPTIKSFLNSVHPDDRNRVAKSMELTTSENQVPNIEYRVVTPEGQERCILSQIKTTCDARGQPLTALGTSMDITERKQAEEEINRSYHIQAAINVILKVALEGLSLEETLKSSIDLVFSIPWLSFESRGSIFLVEDDPNVLVMKAQNGLAQPIQRECARIPFGKCLCGQAALTKEIQFVDCLNERHEISYDGIIPHGHYCVPILSADKVLGVINMYVKEGHHRDKREEEFLSTVADALAGVIERKRAQERIERAADEWRTTFDSITDLISIHDKDNRILRVNKAMADMLKTTPKELIGKFCHEVMHGTKESPANCHHLQTLKTGKSATMETFNSNLGIHLQESTSPLFNEQGEVTGSVIVARDITKQKWMEEQLIVTDRLASIGELASGIAHELNNPLTSVIGFSQLLMEGDVPDNMREDLATVYSEAQRAAVIVKNLLTFARKHTPVKQLSQVNTIVEDVLKLRAYEQKVNNIEVDKQLATNLPEIMSDHFQLQQVFLNIIVNAEFAMQEAHGKGKLIVTTEKFDGVVKVAITDDGPGIAEENLKRIFDPFFTTKEVGKGTGLGLSICHGIVTEHGGKIYARSEKGKGATFIVELPLN
jgi:PAS domain S-box-containing protein